MDRLDLKLLQHLFVQTGAIQTKEPDEPPFKLASGAESRLYIDCRLVILSAEGAGAVGKLMYQEIDARARQLRESGRQVVCLGATGVGGIPIVGAVLGLVSTIGLDWRGFVVRDHIKGHGLQKLVEGHASHFSGGVYFIVEDVITTGGSVIRAAQALRDLHLVIGGVYGVLDREQGGVDTIHGELGVPVKCLLRLSDLVKRTE